MILPLFLFRRFSGDLFPWPLKYLLKKCMGKFDEVGIKINGMKRVCGFRL